MKILVAIKRVIDANVTVRVRAHERGVETANIKMAMNPFCENAVEEALKEKGLASEVVAVSIGVRQCQEIIQSALAMGADRGILVKTDGEVQPHAVAKILKAIVEKEHPEVVLVGKQAIDDDNNQTGQMLAGLLGWAQGTFASKIELADDGRLVVTREYASLPNIMKARKKPIETQTPEDFGVDITDITPRLKTIKVVEPPKREAGVKVASVAELVDKLRK